MFKSKTSSNQLTRILLGIYLAVLIWIILFKLGVNFSYGEARTINWIPFPEVFGSEGKFDSSQIIANVVIFLPFGLYWQLLFPNFSLWKNLFICFLLSFLLETSQYLLGIGALDTTDLITNTAGGFLGLGLVKILQKWSGNSLLIQKTINVFASVGTILIVSLLVLLKLGLLPIRYQ